MSIDYTNSKIKSPIDASDPYNLCVIPSNEHGYDIGYSCGGTHGKTNKWSKYKPVKNTAYEYTSQLVDDTDNGKKWSSESTWWKGYNGSCGLKITPENHGSVSPASLSGIVNIVNSFANGTTDNYYVYDAPTGVVGNTIYPYRLTDWLEYKHVALPPITSCRFETTFKLIEENNTRQYVFDVVFVPTLNAGDGQLGISELGNFDFGTSKLEDWFVGIAFKFSSGSNEYGAIVTCNKTFHDLLATAEADRPKMNLRINAGSYEEKVYSACPVLATTSTNNIVVNENDYAGSILPLPMLSAQSMSLIVPPMANITVSTLLSPQESGTAYLFTLPFAYSNLRQDVKDNIGTDGYAINGTLRVVMGTSDDEHSKTEQYTNSRLILTNVNGGSSNVYIDEGQTTTISVPKQIEEEGVMKNVTRVAFNFVVNQGYKISPQTPHWEYTITA